MIESPVKPAPLSSRRASAPPPDPTTRAMDAPPVAGLVHDRACAECGSPLHADQAACLSCGSMVEETDGRVGLRRAAFSSATALLVLGIAVGAAVAGLPNGKHIGNAPIAQVFGTKAIPPATVTSPPASTTPLPRATAGATPPPPIHHTPAHTSKTPSVASSSTGTGSSGTSTSGGSTTKKKAHHKKNTKPPKKKGPSLFLTGAQPGPVSFFAGQSIDHPSLIDRLIDNNASTAWSTGKHPNGLGKSGVGVWVTAENGPYTGIGLVSPTPGYGVKVYWSDAATAPTKIGDWHQAGSTSSASSRQRLSFSGNAKTATYYLVLITDLAGKASVKLDEIQLFQ